MVCSPSAAQLHGLVARQHILDAIANHSRGVDRADAHLLGAAYHGDATVDYGFFEGPAAQLVEILADAQKGALPTLHRTCHSALAVAGRHALAESYVIACVDGGDVQRLVLGRYLDRLEEREGSWRIAKRTYVLDANCNRAGANPRLDPPLAYDHFTPVGGKGAGDAGRVLLAHHFAATHSARKAAAMPSASPASDAPLPAAAALDAALSRDAIRQLVATYCRGVDRADAELLASIFWPDSSVISGVVNGSGPEFAEGIIAFITAHLDSCFHSVANEWIEVTGDHGVGEHYVIAHMRMAGNEVLTGGRYIDRYERRAGIWKIAARSFVADWTQTQPSSHEDAGFYEALKNRGAFGRHDPVYAHWAALDPVA